MHTQVWQDFDDTLHSMSDKKSRKNSSASLSKQRYAFPALYRQVCHHYALAKARNYSPKLIESLHSRVLDGHQLLYENKTAYLWRIVAFLWVEFPSLLRHYKAFFWLAMLLFYLPAIAMGLACYFDDELIYSVMSEGQVADMEYMYDPSNEHIGRSEERASSSDVMMLGHYIWNNISIDFRVFAFGILAGIGTLAITLFNGVVIGAVAGHLTRLGFIDTFWPFVVGHGSFELTAIGVAGAAGLRLAQPLYAPGNYKRMDAFKLAGRDSIKLLLGAAFMTFVAAFIEAFWSSSSSIPNLVKYAVAALLWLVVIAYLTFAGRGYNKPNG